MQRFKHLVAAATAVLALAAVWGAATASAAEFLTEGSSTVTSSGGGTNTFNFKTSAGICGEFQLSTAISGTHAKSLGSKPPASKCASLFWEKVINNGCEISYQPGADLGGGSFAGTVQIGSSGCAIEFGGKCPVTIPAQSLPATFQNKESGTKRSVEVSINATDAVTYTETGGYSCSPETSHTGDWTGTITLTASSGGTQKGLWVGSNPIWISASLAKLTAETEKVSLSGDAAGQLVIKGKYGTTSCSGSSFGSTISPPVSLFSAQTALSGCTEIGKASTVSMNGCSFVANIESTTKGRLDVSCPAGKSIEFTNGKCLITIPGQTTDSEGITFTQTYSMIQMALSVTGLDSHAQKLAEGIGSCTTGDYTDGTIAGTYVLSGGYL